MPSPSKQTEPASRPILDPHKKRCLKIGERLITPRGDLRGHGIHTLAVEVEKLTPPNLNRGQKNTPQFRFGALAIVAHVPSGSRPDRCQGPVEGVLQRKIVRRLPLPPRPARGLLVCLPTAEGLALASPLLNIRAIPVAKGNQHRKYASIHQSPDGHLRHRRTQLRR